MQQKAVKDLVLQATGLAVGVTMPLLAYFHFSTVGQGSVEIRHEEYKPGSAAEAVLGRLPQVAIVGQKEGPAGTTEVFIQIPGVMNMQSVYVLADGQTVLSGFVLPELQATAVPGGQMTYPTGTPSVDVSMPRENQEALIAMLRGQSEPASEASTAPATLPRSAVSAGSSVKAQLPPPPVPTQSSSNPAGSGFKLTSEPETTSAVNPRAPLASPALKPNNPLFQPVALPTEGEFTQMIRDARSADAQIEEVRLAPDAESQQRAFLELVKSLPAVAQGEGPRHLYVFFDPNCPACHSYYQQLAADVLAGQVTVHWIPAVVLPSQSSGIAVSAHLIDLIHQGQHASALATLGRIMRVPGQADRLHAELEESKNGFRDFIPEVVKHTAVMSMAIPETPLIIYESVAGKLVIKGGIPPRGYIADVKQEL